MLKMFSPLYAKNIILNVFPKFRCDMLRARRRYLSAWRSRSMVWRGALRHCMYHKNVMYSLLRGVKNYNKWPAARPDQEKISSLANKHRREIQAGDWASANELPAGRGRWSSSSRGTRADVAAKKLNPVWPCCNHPAGQDRTHSAPAN